LFNFPSKISINFPSKFLFNFPLKIDPHQIVPLEKNPNFHPISNFRLSIIHQYCKSINYNYFAYPSIESKTVDLQISVFFFPFQIAFTCLFRNLFFFGRSNIRENEKWFLKLIWFFNLIV
jgi:hypothetical protein